MILKAKHHFLVYPFFQWYSCWIIGRHFQKVVLKGNYTGKGLPVLLISNHTSWWDGFWAMYFNLKVLHRKFHFMMLEEQLRRLRFFNYTGGFSVKKSTRSIIESIHYTSQLLVDQGNMVLMFPQGKLFSAHESQVTFQKGIEKILGDLREKVQMIFLVNLTDYLSAKKPTLYMYFKEHEQNNYSLSELQKAYNQFYSQSVEQQSKLSE
jgi:1-acyl-sn-glycerol-3-phosphate acyltransferase